MPVDVFGVHFIVGHSRLQMRVPVNQPFAAVDQPVPEHLEERPPDRFGADLIEGEPCPPPVATRPERFELTDDPLLVGVLPLPDPVDQRLAADVVPRQPFLFEHPPLDDRLRGDAGMIRPRHPQGLIPLHPLPPRDEILTRSIERMPHVQRPGDVRQRDHDRMLLFAGRRVRVEVAVLLPVGEPFGLCGGGIVLLGNVVHGERLPCGGLTRSRGDAGSQGSGSGGSGTRGSSSAMSSGM